MKTFITFYQVNYLGCGILLRFISFLTHFCLISGVTEVMIYHIIGDSYKGDQVYYFVTLAFDLANALLTSIFIEKIQKTFSFRNLASNVFFSNKFFDIDSLFGFYWKLKKMGRYLRDISLTSIIWPFLLVAAHTSWIFEIDNGD